MTKRTNKNTLQTFYLFRPICNLADSRTVLPLHMYSKRTNMTSYILNIDILLTIFPNYTERQG